MSIKVAIVEDHAAFRDGLYHLINNSPGYICSGKYSSVEDALRSIKANTPDVILMDIGLPGMSGIEGVRHIKAEFPQIEILMLTVYEDNERVFHAICAGANGYILKKSPPAKVLEAIQEARGGGTPMTPQIARRVVEMFKQFMPPSTADYGLTPREKEVLNCLMDGMNYKLIAEKLFLSVETVRNHIRHIYEKLQVHSKSQAVAKALKEKLL
jgi:DNA-binding NarL/FixJ family response regulator